MWFQRERTSARWIVGASCVGLLVILIVVVVDASSAAAAVSSTGKHPFRCSRPFSALDKFAPSAMHRRENCEFQFLEVHNARVDVECDGENTNGTGGCYATLHLELAITDQKLIEHELPQDSHEDVVSGRSRAHYHPYYTLELHALNHSRITYKGFDGLGYDLCCDFLNASSAQCEWDGEDISAPTPQADADPLKDEEQRKATRRQRMHYCAVTDASSPRGRLISGSVRKPLHKIIAGDWEVRWTLRRGTETVGRLSVPFEVTQATLSGGGAQQSRHESDHPAAAAAAVPSADVGTAVVTVRDDHQDEDDRRVKHASPPIPEEL
jgi:hypothetical protein